MASPLTDAHPVTASRLLILGSSLTALAVARVAARSGYEVVMLDDRPGPASETRMARFRLLPSSDAHTVFEHVAEEARDRDAVLLADSDRWLRFLVPHFAELEACGPVVLHPQPDAIATCLDKSEFLRWCERQQLPAPRLYESGRRAGRDLTFPLLIRPEASLHAVPTSLPKAREVRDEAELQHWLREFDAARVTATVCESLVTPTVRQFSVGAGRSRQGEIEIFMAEKVRPLANRCAGGTFVRPADMPQVEALARETLDRLDYFGVAEVEILHDPASGRMGLIEVNARPWLQFGLPYACGRDLIGHALGSARAPCARSGRHAWLSFHADLLQCFSRSTGMYGRGEITAAGYLRSVLAADVYLLWDRADPAPFMRSTGRLFARALRRVLRWRRDAAPVPPRPSRAKGP